jgi:hypothetical protein
MGSEGHARLLYRSLAGRPKGKDYLEYLRHKWEVNAKISFK